MSTQLEQAGRFNKTPEELVTDEISTDEFATIVTTEYEQEANEEFANEESISMSNNSQPQLNEFSQAQPRKMKFVPISSTPQNLFQYNTSKQQNVPVRSQSATHFSKSQQHAKDVAFFLDDNYNNTESDSLKTEQTKQQSVNYFEQTKQVDNLQNMLQKLQNKNARFNEDVDRQQTLIAKLETANASLNIDKTQANELIHELNGAIANMSADQASFNNKYQQLMQENTNLSAKIAELSETCDNQTSQINQLKQKLEESEKEILGLNATNNSLQQTLDAMQSEHMAEISLLKQSHMKNEYEMKENFHKNLQSKLDEQKYIHNATLEHQLTKQKENFENQIENLTKSCDIDKQKSIKDNIQETMEQYQFMYDTNMKIKRKEITELNEKIENLLSSKITDQKTADENLIEKLKTQSEELTKVHSEKLDELNKKLANTKDELTKQLTKLQQENKQLMVDNQAIAQLLKTEKQLTQKLNQIAERHLKQVEHCYGLLEQEKRITATWDNKTQQKNDEIESLNVKFENLQQIKDELQKKYNIESGELDSKKILLAEKETQVAELTFQNQMANQNIKILQNELNLISDKLDQEIVTNEAQFEVCEITKTELRQKEETWQEKEKQYMDTIDSLQKQLADASANNLRILDELSMIRDDIKLKEKNDQQNVVNNIMAIKLNSMLLVIEKVTNVIKNLISAEYKFCFQNVSHTISETKDYQCVLNQRKEMCQSMKNGWKYSNEELKNEVFILIKENQSLLTHYKHNIKFTQMIQDDIKNISKLVKTALTMCGYKNDNPVINSDANNASSQLIRDFAQKHVQ